MERRGETFFRETSTDINLEIGVMVSDDVQIKFYHRAKSKMKFMEILGTCKLSAKEAVDAVSKYPYVPLFRYTFHTSFIDNSPCAIFTLPKKELDAPFEGRAKDAIFPSTMTVSTFFIDPAIMEAEHIPYDPSVIPTSVKPTTTPNPVKRNSEVKVSSASKAPPLPPKLSHPLSTHQLPPVTPPTKAKVNSQPSIPPPRPEHHVPFLSVVPNPVPSTPTPLDHSPYSPHIPVGNTFTAAQPVYQPYPPTYSTFPNYQHHTYSSYQTPSYSTQAQAYQPGYPQEASTDGADYNPVFVPLQKS